MSKLENSNKRPSQADIIINKLHINRESKVSQLLNDLARGEGIEETTEEEDEESDDNDRNRTPFESNKVESALTPNEITFI